MPETEVLPLKNKDKSDTDMLVQGTEKSTEPEKGKKVIIGFDGTKARRNQEQQQKRRSLLTELLFPPTGTS